MFLFQTKRPDVSRDLAIRTSKVKKLTGTLVLNSEHPWPGALFGCLHLMAVALGVVLYIGNLNGLWVLLLLVIFCAWQLFNVRRNGATECVTIDWDKVTICLEKKFDHKPTKSRTYFADDIVSLTLDTPSGDITIQFDDGASTALTSHFRGHFGGCQWKSVLSFASAFDFPAEKISESYSGGN